jgi:MFS family permease
LSELDCLAESTTIRNSTIQLGIRPNLGQLFLLIVINAFVGGMVGMERTVVPLLGRNEFGISSTSVITSFIVSFGITKAIVDLLSGPMADRWGRKPILVMGWLIGLPVPFIYDHLRAGLVVDRCCERTARSESRIRLVDDRADEN